MRTILSTFVLATTTLASFAAAQAPARALFLLDRSGSMTIGSPSRCDRSEMQAKLDIDGFFAAFPSGEVTVREFTSAIPSRARWIGTSEWHTNALSARNAVDTAIACANLTPLADAICDSAQAVSVAGASAECYVYVYTDGGENDSQGACSGLPATNATTGRCADDVLHPGAPFTTDAMGGVSWQQRACTTIHNLSLTCDFVLNVYKFDSFADGPLDPAFVFLDSASRATGGLRIEIDDNQQTLPGNSLSVDPSVGCRDGQGALPFLSTIGLPRLGQPFSVSLTAPQGRDRYILLGFHNFQSPVDLGVLGAGGCELKVMPVFTLRSGLLPLRIPVDRGLIGASMEFQGIAVDPTFASPSWLLTSGALSARIH